MHFVSAACRGEVCTMCREPATHKVGEERFHDDPNPYPTHNMTAYVCCWHFGLIVRTVCDTGSPRDGIGSGLVHESRPPNRI